MKDKIKRTTANIFAIAFLVLGIAGPFALADQQVAGASGDGTTCTATADGTEEPASTWTASCSNIGADSTYLSGGWLDIPTTNGNGIVQIGLPNGTVPSSFSCNSTDASPCGWTDATYSQDYMTWSDVGQSNMDAACTEWYGTSCNGTFIFLDNHGDYLTPGSSTGGFAYQGNCTPILPGVPACTAPDQTAFFSTENALVIMMGFAVALVVVLLVMTLGMKLFTKWVNHGVNAA